MKTLSIIKIGGKVIGDEDQKADLLKGFANIRGPKILIHGGGARANALAIQLGVPIKIHQGRRITDYPTLEIAIMVYGGLVNRQMVAQLQSLGMNACGLTGADQGTILSVRRPVKSIDFGYVGDIEKVNDNAIAQMLDNDIVPVFCALTHDGKGQLLNTNADTIASAIAVAMSDRYFTRLYYCFEKPGVLSDPHDEASVISRLDSDKYQQYRDNGTISAGMLPKLENAFRALRGGVQEVTLCNAEAIRKQNWSKSTSLCH